MKIRSQVLPVLAILVGLGGVRDVAAQPVAGRLEVGAQVSPLRLSDFDATNAGLGGRVTFDLTTWAAAEGEFALFPSDDIAVVGSTLSGPDSASSIAGERRRSLV